LTTLDTFCDELLDGVHEVLLSLGSCDLLKDIERQVPATTSR
jgi:hypothetical protein